MAEKTPRWMSAVKLLSLLAFGVFSVPAAVSAAEPVDAETAKIITQMIPSFHVSRKGVDDRISSMLLDSYLKDLDPAKLYFLQSDIDEFAPHRLTLDDELKAGNVQFGYDVFDRYKERMATQLMKAHELIDAPHDFTVDESLVIKGDDQPWARTQEEVDDRWRKRIKYDLLQFRLDNETDEEARKRLHSRYRTVQRNIDQMKKSEVVELYLTALTTCYDPHSTYMSPESAEDFDIQMRLSLDGIGATLRSEDGYTIVVSVVPGGPADKDGRLKEKDKITGVGQETGEIDDVFEVRLSEVVRKIRGKAGTKVRLRVQTGLTGETVVYEITRDKVEIQDSAAKGKIIETKDLLGRPGKIGIISLPSFYRDFSAAETGSGKSAVVDVEKILNDFRDAGGVDAVVMDLRGNGGGALSEAIEISGLFIDQGPVVQVKDPSGKVKELDDEVPGALYTGPLVVICNRLSASASEIFAGVIKDYRRGVVIGDSTTHGKGTVQNLMPVSARQAFRVLGGGGPDLGRLKMTIQQFYRVNGDSTQNRGVRSDVVLPSLLDHIDEGESGLENALPFDQIRNASYLPGKPISPELIAALQKNSEVRVSADKDFQKVDEGIKRFIERKNRKEVSLVESVLRAERETDKAIADEEKKQLGEDEQKDNKDIFPKNFYNDELLNVTLDYLAGLKGQLTVQK
ncbi:MAG: carboxy terminal-processing peptidase [Planctomycetaceae bacterium]